jgi:hypothetical protein
MAALDNVNDIQFDHHLSEGMHTITATYTERGGSPEEDEDRNVGQLDWSAKTGEIGMVETAPSHVRQGIATHMYNLGKALPGKGPSHSNDRTNAGTAWAKSVGGKLPKLKPGIMDRYGQ